MSEIKPIHCRCALDPGAPARVIAPDTICPVPHDRWLMMLPTVSPLSSPYPCRCSRRGGCSPQWCGCAGRVDVENVPTYCCSRNGNTPRAVAIAVHGSEYRTCWCKGDIDLHRTRVAPPVASLIPELPDDDLEED